MSNIFRCSKSPVNAIALKQGYHKKDGLVNTGRAKGAFTWYNMLKRRSPDKAKPPAKRGRKAAGLQRNSEDGRAAEGKIRRARLFCFICNTLEEAGRRKERSEDV